MSRSILPTIDEEDRSATIRPTLAAPTPAGHHYRFKRIAFVIAHLGHGGAQRVVSTAANHFVERGFEVHVLTIHATPADAYPLNASVKRRKLTVQTRHKLLGGTQDPSQDTDHLLTTESRIRQVLKAIARGSKSPVRIVVQLLAMSWIALCLRTKLKQISPDVVLSFLTLTNVMTLMATWRLPIRVIISERNDPRLQRQPVEVGLLRKWSYRRASLVTANSQGALSGMSAYVPAERLAYLPNPVMVSRSNPTAAFQAPTFVSVTRLVPQKGVDVLLHASARALSDLADWRLAILGDGPLKWELFRLAQQLNLADRIDWLGHVDDPIPYLKAAKFFVLTSRFEGSPNALLEAMSCGLPAIVTDASPGPVEIIGQGEAGIIVPTNDVEATARAIARLATDETLRQWLGGAAMTRADQHRPEVALAAWLELMQTTDERPSSEITL